MSVAGFFGIGSKRIRAQGSSVTGRVIDVKTCWWLKINTKPVRKHAMDGAIFPHVIRICYSVDGVEYTGSKWLGPYVECPRIAAAVPVYYDREKPTRYAVGL